MLANRGRLASMDLVSRPLLPRFSQPPTLYRPRPYRSCALRTDTWSFSVQKS